MYAQHDISQRRRLALTLVAVLAVVLSGAVAMVCTHGSDDSSAVDLDNEDLNSSESGTTGQCQWYIRHIGGTGSDEVDRQLVVTGSGKMGDYRYYPPWGTDITSAVIGDGVTYIGSNCFRECDKLTTLVIGKGVTDAGRYAFSHCTALTDLTVPVSFDTNYIYGAYSEDPAIGLPFYHLERVTFTTGNSPVYNYTVNTLTPWYLSRDSLTHVEFTEGVTVIGDNTLKGCYHLSELILPSTLKRIGDGAFQNCTSLTTLQLPGNVYGIGSEAFRHCTGLTDLTIGDSVGIIGDCAFQECTGLRNVFISGEVCELGCYAFADCSDLKTAVVGATVIRPYAFFNCTSLTSATFLDGSVRSAGDYSFYGCTALTDLYLGDILTNIGECAFAYTGIPGIVIPSTVTSLGASAFYGCRSLTSVDMGPTLGYVPYKCFADCPLLSQVDFGKVWAVGDYAFGWCPSLTSVALPDSVRTVGYGAFCWCTSLSNLDLGMVESIGEFAFKGCSSLCSLTIPNAVKEIFTGAFADCTSLEHVSFGYGLRYLEAGSFPAPFFTSDKATELTGASELRGHSFTMIGLRYVEDCTSLPATFDSVSAIARVSA